MSWFLFFVFQYRTDQINVTTSRCYSGNSVNHAALSVSRSFNQIMNTSKSRALFLSLLHVRPFLNQTPFWIARPAHLKKCHLQVDAIFTMTMTTIYYPVSDKPMCKAILIYCIGTVLDSGPIVLLLNYYNISVLKKFLLKNVTIKITYNDYILKKHRLIKELSLTSVLTKNETHY